MKFGWGPHNRDFVRLTDRDIEREWWADYFARLIASGQSEEADAAVQVLEAHGDEAFAEYVAETERLGAEADARLSHDTVPLEEKP